MHLLLKSKRKFKWIIAILSGLWPVLIDSFSTYRLADLANLGAGAHLAPISLSIGTKNLFTAGQHIQESILSLIPQMGEVGWVVSTKGAYEITAILKNGLLNAIGFGGRQTWVWIVIPLSSCVIMDKLIFSEFISFPVQMGMEILCCTDVWIRDKLCKVLGVKSFKFRF